MGKKITRPIIFLEDNYSKKDINKFKKENFIHEVNDIYEDQLSELFEINNPSQILSKNFEKNKNKFIQTKKDKGNWVYFPWNGYLTHTVSESNYYALRTNRNKNIITQDEQNKLNNSVTAVIGLSVGSNIVLNLVYQGISHNLKLADFDTLETSNLNRVPAGIHQVGMLKSNILLQKVYEINPYQKINLLDKLTDKNLENLFTTSPIPNVVFDEVDDFKMKINIRVAAKKFKIPVFMLTSLGDSILIDIERYDLDDNLELFNGRIGDLSEKILKNKDITEEDKKKYALGLVGMENVPKVVIESVMEINKTLVGRPQLSSTVALGGAVGAYLVRNLILDKNLPSGRKLVKFDDIFLTH